QTMNLLRDMVVEKETITQFVKANGAMQSILTNLWDERLEETLKTGIGYFHEAMDRQDKWMVQHLFDSGSVQVVVASEDTPQSIPVPSYMVIVMDI
ncbi:hypothetical protein ARMGADRAFT_934437, partial [Armillaria gallica]